MTIRSSIFSRCTTHAGLKALIVARCYPGKLPQDVTLPAVVYHILSSPPNTYQDHDASPPDRWRYRVQLDCYGSTSDSAAAVGEQCIKAWAGYSNPPAVGWATVANGPIEDRDDVLNMYRNIVEIVIDHDL